MLTVADVLPDVQRVLGGVDRTEGLSRLNDAVEVLATESEWDPLRGFMDITVAADQTITLPRDVGTILGVNVGGRPTQAHDFWFSFHLNGPGVGCGAPTGYHWVDALKVPVYLDPDTTGNQIMAVNTAAADIALKLRVYGYDENDQWIRTELAGVYSDGWEVPMATGFPALPETDCPLFKRITRVSLPAHVGKISLYLFNSSTSAITACGQYFAGDTEPMYRRMKIGIDTSAANIWVRVAFRRTIDSLSLDTDLIPLHSKYAIVMMVKSLMKLDTDRIDEAEKYQLMAINYLNKKQDSLNPPGGPSIQMADTNLLADKHDRIDG